MSAPQPFDPGRVIYVPKRWTHEREQLYKMALAINGLIDGKGNFAKILTLARESMATVIVDNRIRPTTVLAMAPLTPSAAALQLSGITVTTTVGRATIFHAKSSITDLRFGVTILG